MPTFENFTENQSTKMLYMGNTGCLTGDTVVTVLRKTKKKKMSMIELWNLWHFPKRGVQKFADTWLLSDLGGYVGFHKMSGIVSSGRKTVFTVKANGQKVQATADHEFSTATGWKRLQDIEAGEEVWMWRNTRAKEETARGPGKGSSNADREYTHSIPYHPYGFKNIVNGRDYKRLTKARLVIEADINGLTYEQLVHILRTDETRAKTLMYLPNTVDVHHKDEDKTNDSLENLEVMERCEHIVQHHVQKLQAAKALDLKTITSIEEYGETATFDIIMEEPHRNFIANGFVVHNSGKTGSLVALAAAGYNVRILDLDKGVEVIKDFVMNKEGSPYRRAKPPLWDQQMADTLPKRISYIPVSDTVEYSEKSKKLITKGDSWTKAINLLNEWKDGEENLGNVMSWGNKDVLVLDGLSRLADAAFMMQLQMNGRIDKPEQRDYGAAQQALKRLLWMLYSDEVKCNVIMVCHIRSIEVEGEAISRGFPQTIGTALGPEVGQFFNHALLARQSGTGDNVKRVITTKTTSFVQLKTPAPLRVKGEYDLSTGLAEYFADIRKS